MKTERIKLPEELVNYVEGLAHRTAARKDLIAFMIDHGLGESEAFHKYHKEYEELYAQYEIAKDELAQTYVTQTHPNCKWQLNFSTGVLEIEEAE